MNHLIKANAVYVKSNYGKSKNYVKHLHIDNNDVYVEFTQELNEIYPFKDGFVQKAMELLATPFISNLINEGKTEQEILSWVQENIGSDQIDIHISK